MDVQEIMRVMMSQQSLSLPVLKDLHESLGVWVQCIGKTIDG